MNNVKYTAAFFKETMPEWKRKKDPFLSRIFYRPISFYLASICANHGISANTVSYASTLLAVIACSLFFIDSEWCPILGALLCNVWLIMDCIDGNLARSVKKQPFGEFADGISSYILVGFIGVSMGWTCYNFGGYYVEKENTLILLLGALSGSFDTMMRLIYQKYKATERDLNEKDSSPKYDSRLDHTKINNWRNRIESDLGMGGILPLLILLGTIFHFLDIVIFYCLCYYGGSFVISTISLIRKAQTYKE